MKFNNTKIEELFKTPINEKWNCSGRIFNTFTEEQKQFFIESCKNNYLKGLKDADECL